MMYYVSISIALLSSVHYHLSQRATPRGVSPPLALLVTYAVAMALAAVLLLAMPAQRGLLAELRRLNGAGYVLAMSIVGLEVGFLLACRSVWNLGLYAVITNVAAALRPAPVALRVFKDQLNRPNPTGILTCLAGLIMLNWRR